MVRNPPRELNFFVLQQQQNLGRRFGTSKMHLSPPPPPPSGFGCCPFQGRGSVNVDSLLIVHSSFAIISMGKRELVALLCLSSWCPMIVVWFFFTMPWVCMQFVIVVFLDHTHLLFFDVIRLYV